MPAAMSFFISSAGHGEPAMIPVRTELRSYAVAPSPSSRAHSAMNMVGTPYRLVHRSCATAARVAAGSKAGAGITMHAPWLVAARLPMTMPKQ